MPYNLPSFEKQQDIQTKVTDVQNKITDVQTKVTNIQSQFPISGGTDLSEFTPFIAKRSYGIINVGVSETILNITGSGILSGIYFQTQAALDIGLGVYVDGVELISENTAMGGANSSEMYLYTNFYFNSNLTIKIKNVGSTGKNIGGFISYQLKG